MAGKDTSTGSLQFLSIESVFQRRMRAQDHAFLPQERKGGIYVPQFLFDARLPKGYNPNHFREKLTEEEKQEFENHVKRTPLTEAQLAFTLECQAPTNGFAIARWPPVKGKSATLVALIEGWVKSGKKVLVCGQTESAFKDLMFAWNDTSDDDVHLGRWCLWDDYYAQSGYLEKPRAPKVAKPTQADDNADAASTPAPIDTGAHRQEKKSAAPNNDDDEPPTLDKLSVNDELAQASVVTPVAKANAAASDRDESLAALLPPANRRSRRNPQNGRMGLR